MGRSFISHSKEEKAPFRIPLILGNHQSQLTYQKANTLPHEPHYD